MKIHVHDRSRNQCGERSRIIVVSQRPVHRAYSRARRPRLSRDVADEGQGQPRHDDDRRRAHREPSHRSPRPLLGRIPTRGGARARREVGRSRLGARRWRHGDGGVDAPRASVVTRGSCRPPRGRRRAPTSAERVFGVRDRDCVRSREDDLRIEATISTNKKLPVLIYYSQEEPASRRDYDATFTRDGFANRNA